MGSAMDGKADVSDDELVPVCAGCYEQRPLVGWVHNGGLRGRACASCSTSQGDVRHE